MQEYPKSEVFALLRVERSSYYRWRSREDDPAARQMAEAVTMVFGRHSRRYGSRRIHAEMTAEGYSISRHRIRRVMASQGLKAIQPRSFVPRTTHGDRRRYHISATVVRQMVLYGDLDRSILAACPRLVDPRRYDRKAGDRGVSDDAEPNRTAKGLHHSFGSRRTVRLEELSPNAASARLSPVDEPSGRNL